MKVREIEVHDITLEYCDWTAYQLNHYYGPVYRTVYVAHTDDGLVGWGEACSGATPEFCAAALAAIVCWQVANDAWTRRSHHHRN